MPSSALTLAWLALVAHGELPEQQRQAGASGAIAEAADVVWRYDTGG